jgi:acyl-ACP thioesterase
MIEFVRPPDSGRLYTSHYSVRLSDADPSGAIRWDSLARYLQDIASDDWDEIGVDSNDFWVVRRTSMRRVGADAWPNFKQVITLRTWCAGAGPAWVERRTDVVMDDEVIVETAALAVQVNPQGQPVRIRPEFLAVYGEAIGGRKVSGRVVTPEVTTGAVARPWQLRRADLDVVGHVNNAACWQALDEVALSVREVTFIHHGSLALDDEVTLFNTDDALWLCVAGAVQVSAAFS